LTKRQFPAPIKTYDIWRNECQQCNTVNPSMAKDPPPECAGCGASPIPVIRQLAHEVHYWAGSEVLTKADIERARNRAARKRDAEIADHHDRRARLARALLARRSQKKSNES
jgi:hypothetical protein